MRILLSCLLFLLIAASLSYNIDQQAKAKGKPITISNITSNTQQASKKKDPQQKEIATLHKKNSTQISATPTPIPTSASNASQQHSQNSNANGESTPVPTTTSPTATPTPIIIVTVQPTPSATQPVPPTPPSSADKAAAAQAAKDAFNSQTNQPVTTPIVVSGSNNTSSVTVPSTNGAYSENQVIPAVGNTVTVTVVGTEVGTAK